MSVFGHCGFAPAADRALYNTTHTSDAEPCPAETLAGGPRLAALVEALTRAGYPGSATGDSHSKAPPAGRLLGHRSDAADHAESPETLTTWVLGGARRAFQLFTFHAGYTTSRSANTKQLIYLSYTIPPRSRASRRSSAPAPPTPPPPHAPQDVLSPRPTFPPSARRALNMTDAVYTPADAQGALPLPAVSQILIYPFIAQPLQLYARRHPWVGGVPRSNSGTQADREPRAPDDSYSHLIDCLSPEL
ncbi:hypothetical protein B0H15DRAFT_947506 [Mycena belliarum]|uniref:Uncharacterized protein n=1 Tax=Mycena belliarum TaxID=1033014 RepID=A0AAD6UCT4_9AGAR|nr:hypothetical protein B0H15DRAFT_947506 [Mycena belliae]